MERKGNEEEFDEEMNDIHLSSSGNTLKISNELVYEEVETSNIAEASNNNTEEKQIEYNVEGKRWWILINFCIFTFSNALNFLTYGAVTTTVIHLYGITEFEVDVLTSLFMVSYLISVAPASYIVDKQSIRKGLIIGGFLNAIGASIRILPWPFTDYNTNPTLSFIIAVIGQTIAGFAQPFAVAMPPKLAQNWFAEKERVKIIAIGAIFANFGASFTFIVFPLLVAKNENVFTIILILSAVFSILSFILLLFFFQNSPKMPPSISTNMVDKEISYFHTLKLLFKNIHYILLVLFVGLSSSFLSAIPALFNQILALLNYDGEVQSELGISFIISSILGVALCGYLADKYQKYRLIVLIFTVGSTGGSVLFYFVCKPDFTIPLIIVCSILAFFLAGATPVCFDAAMEITFPLPQVITTNILLISTQLFSILMILSMGWLLQSEGLGVMNIYFIALSIACLILIFFYNGKHSRNQIETLSHQTKSNNGNVNLDQHPDEIVFVK